MAFKALGNTLLGNATPQEELLQNDCEALLPSCPGWDWLAARGCNHSISIYFLLRPGEAQEADCHSSLFQKHRNIGYHKAFV